MAAVHPAEKSPEAADQAQAVEDVYAPPKAKTQSESGSLARAFAGVPWVATTYYAEGLPYSIVHQISSELFTSFGASLSANGRTALYGLAWNLKFLWSPAVDIYGTLRRWVIGTQIILGLVILTLAEPAQQGRLTLMAWGLGVVAVLAATQDIAVDGFYLEALPDKQQAELSGLRVAAYRAAMLVGKSGLVVLAGVLAGWRWPFVAAAAMMLLLGGVHALLLPRHAAPRASVGRARPKSGGFRFLEAFISFAQQRHGALVLAFLLTYRAGDALMFAMGSPFLKSLGFETAARGAMNGAAATAFMIVSMIAGVVVARVGFERTIRPFTLVQSAAILLYAWLAWARPSAAIVTGVLILEQVASALGTAILSVFLLRRCQGPYRASHFAVASALMSVATTLAGSVSGDIAERVGFFWFFVLAFAASLPGAALAFVVPTGRADEA